MGEEVNNPLSVWWTITPSRFCVHHARYSRYRMWLIGLIDDDWRMMPIELRLLKGTARDVPAFVDRDGVVGVGWITGSQRMVFFFPFVLRVSHSE